MDAALDVQTAAELHRGVSELLGQQLALSECLGVAGLFVDDEEEGAADEGSGDGPAEVSARHPSVECLLQDCELILHVHNVSGMRVLNGLFVRFKRGHQGLKLDDLRLEKSNLFGLRVDYLFDFFFFVDLLCTLVRFVLVQDILGVRIGDDLFLLTFNSVFELSL